MRLLHDDVTIGEGAGKVRLRPSLRAGMRLSREFGLGRLVAGVDGLSFTIVAAIVDATAEEPRLAFGALEDMVMRDGLAALATIRPALGDLLAACFGIDRDNPEAKHPAEEHADATGKPFSFEPHFEELFEIGTGWLEWSPSDCYAATPAEILIAQRGKIKLLQAIHGTADKDASNHDPREDVTAAEVRDGLARLRAMSGSA